jgi:hypothetical protein
LIVQSTQFPILRYLEATVTYVFSHFCTVETLETAEAITTVFVQLVIERFLTGVSR